MTRAVAAQAQTVRRQQAMRFLLIPLAFILAPAQAAVCQGSEATLSRWQHLGSGNESAIDSICRRTTTFRVYGYLTVPNVGDSISTHSHSAGDTIFVALTLLRRSPLNTTGTYRFEITSYLRTRAPARVVVHRIIPYPDMRPDTTILADRLAPSSPSDSIVCYR